jgi:carbamoyltransferase
MLALGLAGGLDAIHEQKLDTPENYAYDGAAVLVEDGEVVAAIEEERLDRIKHSSKFPWKAIRFCLERRGVGLQDLDRIAYYVDETTANTLLERMYLANPAMTRRIDARTLLRATLGRTLGGDADPSRFRFYEHKLTHAACAMHQSGFDEALVYVIDNAGGIYIARRDANARIGFETLATTTPARSMQRLCQTVLPFLGFGIFEEYKALALAPAGDPERFRGLLDEMYELLPEGQYQLRLERAAALAKVVEPRRAGTEPGRNHKDLAAALQAAMERIVIHVLKHFGEATGLANLCLAGGMSENTSTNACILYSGLFESVFVHPAAYDSGCAIGAALLASEDMGAPSVGTRIGSLRWGSELGSAGTIDEGLGHWAGLLRAEREDDVARRTAELIAGGAVVAWLQGRSDFGSHALGSRNVLADPRSVESRGRVHAALGRAETYRPLALLIPEEDVGLWCDLPGSMKGLPFPSYAVPIHKSRKASIEGAMQGDGAARLQTVSEQSGERLWSLLRSFGELTGTAALLSASFNSAVEPVVESLDDGVTSFLSSGVDYLVAGDRIAEKAALSLDEQLALQVSLPPYAQLVRTRGLTERSRRSSADEIRTTTNPETRQPVSPELAALLWSIDEEATVRDLLRRGSLDGEASRRLTDELMELWKRRLVVLRPAAKREAAA